MRDYFDFEAWARDTMIEKVWKEGRYYFWTYN